MDTLFGKFTKTKKEPEKQNDKEYKPKEEPYFKISFFGEDYFAAKTCFLNRYVRNVFPDEVEPTIGANILTKSTVSRGKEVNLEIWDTAGNYVYLSLLPMYLRDAVGFVVFYDVTKRSSLECARERYIEPIKFYCPDAVVMIIGNKVDLVFEDESRREVSVEEGEELARKFGTNLFFEVSAKTGYNVNESMDALVDAILESKGY